MTNSSQAGQAAIDEIAQRHGFSPDAASEMLDALISGGGRMAQFNHREFGGHGQWMSGGMTMISDMFNNHLKARVAALCDDLSALIAQQGDRLTSARPAAASRDWWPAELGTPNTSGAQNSSRYAWFGQSHRLAIENDGFVTVYDTQDHQITGVSQQQSTSRALVFTSQHGPVDVAKLPVVSKGF